MCIITQRQSNGSAAIFCPLNFFQSLNIFAVLFSLMRKDAKSCCLLPMCSVGTVARCARGVQACCAAGTFVELYTCLLDKGSKLRLCQFKENMIEIGSKFGLRLRTRKEAVETAAWLQMRPGTQLMRAAREFLECNSMETSEKVHAFTSS